VDFKSFRAIYERQYEEMKNALGKQEEMLKRLFRNGVASGVRLQKFKDAMKLTELNRDALLCFISRIEVYEDKRIYVEFREKEEFDKMLVLQEYLKEKEREGRV
jgi:dsDNA-binding SOS-regulon protein